MPSGLAAQLRAKHPGVYDDMDDATLESRVIAKYPQYKDLSGPAKPAAPERTWTDTAVDALPMLGGMAGATIGGIGGAAFGLGVGGIPGSMGGAALGGGAGEAARQLVQRFRGNAAPATSGEAASAIGGEAATQGALEGLGGAAIIGGTRLVRGLRKVLPSVSDVAIGGAKSLVSKQMPIIGAVRSSIEDQQAKRLAREALGSGRLVGKAPQLNDELIAALKEATASDVPMKVGGVTRPLSGKGVTMNPEVSRGMVTTAPDKWGMSSIRTRADEALSYPRSDTASAFTMEKRAAGLPPKVAPPKLDAPLAWQKHMVDTGSGSTMSAVDANRQALTGVAHPASGLDPAGIKALRDAAQARHDALFKTNVGAWNTGGGQALTASERALLDQLRRSTPMMGR